MPTSRFSSLITVEDWAAELATILSEVEQAVQSGESEERSRLQDLLFEYIKASPTAAESLDKIALQASEDLLKAQVEDAVGAIAARNAELKSAAKLIQRSTTEARSSKEAIQFEKVTEALSTAKAGIDALRKLDRAVRDEDSELTRMLTEIATAISDLERLAARAESRIGRRRTGQGTSG
jgi:hypothetical protein